MRQLMIVSILLGLAAVANAGTAGDPPLDWTAWRSLPVQNAGRCKPLDTLARESLQMISGRASWTDPETGQSLEPTALWLTAFFDWQGWEHPQRQQLLSTKDWRSEYFHLHHADKWDRVPLLRVDSPELQAALGLQQDEHSVSVAQLAAIMIDDPRTEIAIPFSAWTEKLSALDAAQKPLNALEKQGLNLAERYWAYQSLRMGRTLEVLPLRGSATQNWIPLGTLLITDWDDATDPGGGLRKAQQCLRQALAAYRLRHTDDFRTAADQLLIALRDVATELGPYPSASIVAVEVAYHQWAPFRIAWVLMLLALVCFWLRFGSGWTWFGRMAASAYAAACLAALAGFAMRITIAGRPPVTNMYESVVYVGTGVALLGLAFYVRHRRSGLVVAATAVASVAWILADSCPTIFDPSFRPLEPVLHSNFWLVTHVMTITLSYAAFALALGVANITLGYLLIRSTHRAAIDAMSRFTYQAIQVGVLLLAAGIVLGGVWADYAWGRFWGWDPKEVWALVALLGYLAVLHAQHAGWVGQPGLAALAVTCFVLVVIAWYGVNFVLGTGLHSYGFGVGGLPSVLLAVTLQMLYLVLALARGRDHFHQTPAAWRAITTPLPTG